MADFLRNLLLRNPLLYYAGWVCGLLGIACVIMMLFDHRQIMGINAWIKPFKFAVSVGIFIWTMAWYMPYINRPVAVKWYSLMVVIVFAFELAAVFGQAARGQLSHFNITTPINGAIFQLMGVAIVTLVVWTGVIGFYFFQKGQPAGLPPGYWWGIRLGIVLFIIFSFEGGLMAANLRHTVGAPDGGEGLPLVNWSKTHGDLRIAHFVGLHALQVLPLLGYFWLKKPYEIMMAAALYTFLAVWLFLRAMAGKPLFA